MFVLLVGQTHDHNIARHRQRHHLRGVMTLQVGCGEADHIMIVLGSREKGGTQGRVDVALSGERTEALDHYRGTTTPEARRVLRHR